MDRAAPGPRPRASIRKARSRLESTEPGTDIHGNWAESESPRLLQTRHAYMLTDNTSGMAEWKVHVKLIWHRPWSIPKRDEGRLQAVQRELRDVHGGVATARGGAPLAPTPEAGAPSRRARLSTRSGPPRPHARVACVPDASRRPAVATDPRRRIVATRSPGVYRRSTMNDESCCAPQAPVTPPADLLELALDVSRVAKALAHPIRVRIVSLLLARETCVCGEIVAELPVSQATVSQHLKVLRDAGLIRGEIDGPRVCYCVDRDALARHVGTLARLGGTHATHDLEAVR